MWFFFVQTLSVWWSTGGSSHVFLKRGITFWYLRMTVATIQPAARFSPGPRTLVFGIVAHPTYGCVVFGKETIGQYSPKFSTKDLPFVSPILLINYIISKLLIWCFLKPAYIYIYIPNCPKPWVFRFNMTHKLESFLRQWLVGTPRNRAPIQAAHRSYKVLCKLCQTLALRCEVVTTFMGMKKPKGDCPK